MPETAINPTTISNAGQDEVAFFDINKIVAKATDDFVVAVTAMWPFNMWFVVLPLYTNFMITVGQLTGIAGHS